VGWAYDRVVFIERRSIILGEQETVRSLPAMIDFSDPFAKQTLEWSTLVVEPLKDLLMDIAGFLPDLLVAICILIIGCAVAKLAQIIVSAFLKAVGIDQFAESIGISGLLQKGEKPIPPHKWFGSLIFWVVIIVSLVMCSDQLHLRIASRQLDSFLYFSFKAFGALVIFIIGMCFSLIAYKVVRAVAENLQIQPSNLYANIAKWTTLIFTAIASLNQIGLPPEIILTALGIGLGTLCITFILAFGIGGTTWAGKVLNKITKD